MLESLTSLFTLTVLEVVLSIDNLVVIAVLVGKLPKDQQANARYVGMTLALLPRLVLLVFIGWIIGLTEPLFDVFGHGVSGKDLILAAGGLFLIYKATHEIHAALEGDEGEASAKVLANYAAVVAQIAIINLVFSIDSIVTAVGMANEIWVMAVAERPRSSWRRPRTRPPISWSWVATATRACARCCWAAPLGRSSNS